MSSQADVAPDSGRSFPVTPFGAYRAWVQPGVLALVTLVMGVAGFLYRVPCQNRYFDSAFTYRHGCYTDIYPLYFGRGLADGKVPYLDKVSESVEYPVLTGWFMQAVNSVLEFLVPGSVDAADRGILFYEITYACVIVLSVVTVLATAYAAGKRYSLRAGLMVALSPALFLAAGINWDMLAVALLAVSIALWSKGRTVSAGVLLGLAISAKFYPVLLLWPLLLLCWRSGRMRAFYQGAGAAAVAWLVVNVPVMILAWDAWTRFYRFSQTRGVDFGSLLYVPSHNGWNWVNNIGELNHVCEIAFAVCAVLVGVLVLRAPVRPRVPQVFFLMVAVFLLTNKVWSPQYVLWLLPLAVLARPRVPGFVTWQIGEVVYYFGIWWLLLDYITNGQSGISESMYFYTQLARFLTVLGLCALVVVDILRPSHDPVRADGEDDPAGGVLAHAPDALAFGR